MPAAICILHSYPGKQTTGAERIWFCSGHSVRLFVDFDLVKTFRELLTGRLSRIIMKMEALEGVWLNGLLFFPLGYLVPEMGAQRGLNARILSVLFLGIFVSAWTECLQFATGLGYFDVDDLIYNTAGCMAGIWTWRRQRKKGVL